ncbi:MAG TPA: hypothetical protein VGD08_09765 [Stellaceae bacterium]|jgi:hypothetical protein
MTERERNAGAAADAADELRDYEAEKCGEQARQDRPAQAERDPAWNARDHLDPMRGSHRRDEDAAKDAVGQAEHGVIDQTVTSKGFTNTK